MGAEGRLTEELWYKLMVFDVEDIFVLESSSSIKPSRCRFGHFGSICKRRALLGRPRTKRDVTFSDVGRLAAPTLPVLSHYQLN